MVQLPDRIMRARKHVLGLKQRELAAILDVEPVTVSRWERGVSEPEMANLRALSKLSGMPVSWFYEETAA